MRNLLRIATDVKQQARQQLKRADARFLHGEKITANNLPNVLRSKKIIIRSSELDRFKCVPIEGLVALWLLEKWHDMDRVEQDVLDTRVAQEIIACNGIEFNEKHDSLLLSSPSSRV